MVREIKKVELTNGDGFPRRYTVASNVAITKGTLLSLDDGRIAAIDPLHGEAIAGIANQAKSASDFSTSIAVWTDGVFECAASGTITRGVGVIAAGVDNMVFAASSLTLAASGAAVIGYAMDTAADEETINIRIQL